jgi:hypothetical protein
MVQTVVETGQGMVQYANGGMQTGGGDGGRWW